MLAGAGRPRKACSRCKSHKVRCSGEKPACKRCSRLKHICVYDTDDNRETFKRNKAASSFKRTEFERLNSSLPDLNTSRNIATCQQHTDSARPSSWTHPNQTSYLGIPMSLVVTLVDVYYANVYNASLLLHKRTLLTALAADTVQQHVVLGVCALALNFYQNTDDHSILYEHNFSTEWADRAGKLAFQDIENPAEDHVVTFMNLALFWYSQGAWRRSAIHKGNAAQISHLLGIGAERVGAEDSFALEVRRRRFWACYLMHCHAIDMCFTVGAGDSALKLTLPWREKDYSAGLPSQPRVCLRSGGSNEGIFCELVKAMTFWSEVNTFVKSSETNISEKLHAIYELDDRISDWWSNFPIPLHMTPSDVPTVADHTFPNLLLIHIVYHQCLCALHASIVPLFCWGAAAGSWISARQTSAQIAFEHACAASALIDAVLSSLHKLSAIPSFVAYAAYCGCAIQIPFAFSSAEAVRQRAQNNVKANFRMIVALAKYWKFTAVLESHVRCIYKIHAKNNIPLENEPKLLDPRKLTNFRINARHARQSILGHNDILWRDGNVLPGSTEDVVDLGIEEDDVDAPLTGTFPADNNPENMPRASAAEAHLGVPHSSSLRIGSFSQQHQPLMPAQSEPFHIPHYDGELPELESLDFFRPFHDPEMLDLFPNGQPLEFPYLQSSPASLDFCGLWAPTDDQHIASYVTAAT